MSQSNTGRYINICGVDGVGKSTLAKVLAEKIGAKLFYEPDGETEITKALRSHALAKDTDMSAYSRESLMVANRSLAIDRKLPHIKNGETIVCDRGLLSGYAYANADSGFEYREWRNLHRHNFERLIPDLIIFVEVKNRKIDPNKDIELDLYDSKSVEFFNDLSDSFEDGIRKFVVHENIPVNRFFNDFNISVEENVERLISTLKLNGYI